MRAFEHALDSAWAMAPEHVETLLTIAAREHDVTPEALEAYRAAPLNRAERGMRRGDVAILNVTGPLFRRANLMTEFSGATSYDVLRTDLQAALDEPAVRSIVLNVDSPGGEVNGVDELAKAIFAARGAKPITAYVGGMAASGGYWIASAADEVVVSDAAILGSIGVYMAIKDTAKRDEARGERRIEFVSSQSPDKRPDYSTDEGRARVQRTVDQLADVFITAVAKHRGVNVDSVIADFGRGGVEVGAAAVAAGMADRIGTFEGVLADLSRGGGQTRAARSFSAAASASAPTRQNGEKPMTDTPKADASAADLDKIRAEAVAADRARRSAILALDEAKGREALAEHLYTTALSIDDVKAALAAAPKAEAPKADAPASPEAYDAARAAAAGLAAPSAPAASVAKAGWAKAAARINTRR